MMQVDAKHAKHKHNNNYNYNNNNIYKHKHKGMHRGRRWRRGEKRFVLFFALGQGGVWHPAGGQKKERTGQGASLGE